MCVFVRVLVCVCAGAPGEMPKKFIYGSRKRMKRERERERKRDELVQIEREYCELQGEASQDLSRLYCFANDS